MSLEMVRSVALERTGSGDPLLLIHGTGGTRGHWDPVRDRLAAQRSLLLVDLPGHGQSPSPRGTPSNPIGYARTLAGVLDELGHSSVHVAGNSVGGWTASSWPSSAAPARSSRSRPPGCGQTATRARRR
jgi:pimeloyl-ACP methyl ester carboxylesterase